MSKEIENIDDIKLLVDKFYSKVRDDEMLKDIFNNVIQDRWPEHLEKCTDFGKQSCWVIIPIRGARSSLTPIYRL